MSFHSLYKRVMAMHVVAHRGTAGTAVHVLPLLCPSTHSGERPLTNLRPARVKLPATVPEPTTLITFITCGASLFAYRLRRRLNRSSRRRRDTIR